MIWTKNSALEVWVKVLPIIMIIPKTHYSDILFLGFFCLRLDHARKNIYIFSLHLMNLITA